MNFKMVDDDQYGLFDGLHTMRRVCKRDGEEGRGVVF